MGGGRVDRPAEQVVCRAPESHLAVPARVRGPRCPELRRRLGAATCLCFSRRYMKHKRDDGPDKQEDEAVDVTPVMTCVFVVMCCSMLVLLYFFYDHLGASSPGPGPGPRAGLSRWAQGPHPRLPRSLRDHRHFLPGLVHGPLQLPVAAGAEAAVWQVQVSPCGRPRPGSAREVLPHGRPRPIAPSPWVQLPRCREPSVRGVARLAQRGRGAGPYSVLVRAHGPLSPHVPLQGRPGGRGGRAVTWVRVGGRPRPLLPGTLSGSAWAAAAALGFRPGAQVAGSLSEGERAGPAGGLPRAPVGRLAGEWPRFAHPLCLLHPAPLCLWDCLFWRRNKGWG